MRLKDAWGSFFDGDRIGKPTDVSCRTPGYLMRTKAMKGAVGPLRRAARKDDVLCHLNLFSQGD